VDDGKGKRCSAAIDKFVADVNTKPVAQLADIRAVCVNTEVNFDASGSSDADGNALKYAWDFGDGKTMEGPAKVSHTYKTGGEYNVSVTVDDQTKTPCSKDTKSINLRVNRPPVADAGPNLVCCVGTESKFDGSSSSDPDGDLLSYAWNLGDGNSATGQKIKYIYTKPGKYTITLTVKDNSGTSCDTATDSFEATVSDKPVSVMDIKPVKR
ncbi:MAG: PKD domain-containing protein, partial [Candidatus Omnitrophota bacterium]